MLVYLSVAGMWVLKAHHIFSLHFVCFLFHCEVMKSWGVLHSNDGVKGCRFSSAACRLSHRGCLFLLWHLRRTMEMSHLGNGWQERPSLLWPSLVITEVLKRVGTVSKGMKTKISKDLFGQRSLWSNDQTTPLPHWRGTLHLNSLLSAKMETCTRQGHGRLVPLSSLVPWKKTWPIFIGEPGCLEKNSQVLSTSNWQLDG